MIKRLAELSGWLGMALIQGATLPVSVPVILGWSDALPPLSMVLLVWLGLGLFLFNSLVRRDWLYIASNGIGFILNTILLALIVLRFY